MMKCARCGGKMKRVHRTFAERINYLAIYECRNCEEDELVPRRFRYHLGETARCPQCGTARITRLKQRDKIDRMQTGGLNVLERLLGGDLYHCRFCRLQFYDRRKTARPAESEPGNDMVADPAGRALKNQPDTARSDV